MGKPRRALGRGLDALIPAEAATPAREIDLDDILPNANQPRKRFDDERLADLAASIRDHGVLQPLIVSRGDREGKFRLVVGERRWQAAHLAGLKKIPVIVRETSEVSSLELALVENIQREDLDPLEEATAFERLIEEHGYTQENVARRVGRSRSAVANSLRLLGLPTAIKDALIAGDISEGHARALLGVPDPLLQEALLRRVRFDGLNVRQTEDLVRGANAPRATRKSTPPPRSPEIQRLEDDLRSSLGTKVAITRGHKAGKIIIEFYSDDDLTQLYERLSRP